MIYLLVMILAGIFVGAYCLNQKEVTAPSVMFCVSFLFSSIWALAYADKWDLHLNLNTFLVLVGGCIIYVVFSKVTSVFVRRILVNRHRQERQLLHKIEIERWKLFLFIIFEIIVIFYTLKVMRSQIGGDSISAIISIYRVTTAHEEEAALVWPRLLSHSRTAVLAAGWWFVYVIINNYLCEKKVPLCEMVVVILSVISSSLTGGRMNAINILLAAIAYAFVLDKKVNGKRKGLNGKKLMTYVFLCVIALICFQRFGIALGRDISEVGFFDYLAKYCGAQVKNLDLYLQDYKGASESIWGSQTFRTVINWIGVRLGGERVYYDLPFRQINGFNLGNTYTMYYDYIYDFGYFGMCVLVAAMAVIIQTVYEKTSAVICGKRPSISILLYGYLFNSIIFAFFSNRFYRNFSNDTIKTLLCWWLFGLIFVKIRFVFKNRR